jgi:hypothetical protein
VELYNERLAKDDSDDITIHSDDEPEYISISPTKKQKTDFISDEDSILNRTVLSRLDFTCTAEEVIQQLRNLEINWVELSQ